MRARRAIGALFGALSVIALLGGCGSSSAPTSQPAQTGAVTLQVGSNPVLGHFLVSDGRTLYMYPPDQRKAVTCTKVGDCQRAWPPLFEPAGGKVQAGPGVKQGLIGAMPGDGGKVVTYNRWPLYFYLGDHQPGDVNGQDQGFNWFVIGPNGAPIRTTLPSPTG